ncbi:uncharacterized protein LOC113239102 [Hyposmocoma kahamanoa]|uniref:uncharacterized protein LOC113239102 n=1 Tax=Hyposmocoma kahamanoa TaxID=1477025 RepID=UPI000E6D6996|nr:uncharacterized protein LOC113239102 [Hyposmocoma kahamanoa]
MYSSVKSNITTFASFNCKCFKRSIDLIRNLCKTADVVALQETWLLPHDLPLVGTVSESFEYTCKSAVDTSVGIRKGRPFGGVALLWRKGIFDAVAVLNCNSVRLAAIRVTIEKRSVIIFSIYMPNDDSTVVSNTEFVGCLAEIDAIIENNDVHDVLMLGDFNAHPHTQFWMKLQQYCGDRYWKCADTEFLGLDSGTITFISDIDGSRRWLDHCVVTRSAWNTVFDIKVENDVQWSDHFPLIIRCKLGAMVPKMTCEVKTPNRVLWRTRSNAQITQYFNICNSVLEDIHMPEIFTRCTEQMCTNSSHQRALDELYRVVVCALSDAAIKSHDTGVRSVRRPVIGWNNYVREAHGEARLKFQTWLLNNKPVNGKIWDDMRDSRKIFKSRLRWCQSHQEQIKMDIVASHRASKKFSQFWRATNSLNVRPGRPMSVGSCTEAKEIADLFKNHFKVSSTLGSVDRMIDARVDVAGGLPLRFSATQVASVIKGMTRGKSPGHDGLSVEHLKHAGVHLPRVLSLFYSLCISHSYLPAEMMRTVVVPLIKNKTGDISDVDNYRPISLATVMAKVLDCLLDSSLDQFINLHDAQFGFRPKLSTESAILCLKQTVQYYSCRKTPVYACFLDLSKAFDLVCYDLLWDKLRGTGVPEEIIALLRYWYCHQDNNVKWGETLSDTYRLECGVRQGGITSPKLFNLYVNELIVRLSGRPVGCWIDGLPVNNFSYADDMVLLGPSAGSVRQLLDICVKYCGDHGLVYNAKKSEYMIFEARGNNVTYEPVIKLKDVPLKRVKLFKYLGHYISEDLKDHADIERERRALAAKCNMLAHRFARCSNEAKLTLFKAYCQTFYTCALWARYSKKVLDTLRVQYNNGFRVLLGLPRYCSASGMFADMRTDDFWGMLRKKTASLLLRMRGSSNSILKMFAHKTAEPMLEHFVDVLVWQATPTPR